MSNIENPANLCHNLCMFIIECLPFSKGLNKDSLSYFSPQYIEPGSLIKVSLRGKSVNALVTESRDAAERKAEIKSADFQLKKISSVTAKPFLQREFLEAVKDTAEYFAASRGNVLSHLIPSFVLENPNALSVLKKEEIKINSVEKKTKSEVAVLQVPDEERFIHYRSLIREEFAKKKSVFLCLPQNEDVRQAKEKLERGIEPFVYAFHNDLSKKDLKKEWKEVCLTPHPILVLATAKWLFLPRNDFGTIIIDKENENGWKTLSRPFIDLRFFAESLANKKNIRTVIGDSFLRVETLNRYKQGEITEFENVKWRLPKDVAMQVVDLRKSSKKASLRSQEKEFKTLSPEILGLINETISKGSNMFIFAARKGLSSVIVCRDCGEQVKCFNCSSPMVLYKTKSGGAFKCHQCGETRDAAELCQNCKSWKLAAFGSGIDRVEDEIRKSIPNVNLFEIHKDATPTSIKALKVAENFYGSRGSVLLGTEMAFSYLYKKVTNSAVVSFDSLFSIPDFRIGEKIFRLILQTKSLAKENFLIQTRNLDDPTVEFAVSGNLVEFYKKEIENREALGYPPFGIFIKITVRGTRIFVSKETENLKNILKDYNPAIFNSVHEKRGEQSAVNAVIKLPRSDWPDFEIISILKSLPPHFEIKVDPDNLL
jgi:primosomal protein N'